MTIDKARRRKSVARWHRRFAVFVSLWLVVLAGSGVVINHAHDWGLDRIPLPASAQRWFYGIESSSEDFCSSLVSIDQECSRVFARLPLPGGALLLARDSLFLLDESGQLVEKLAVGQLGLNHLQAGFSEGSRIYLRDAQKTVLTDADLMQREVLDSQAAQALDGRDWQAQNENNQSEPEHDITWERLLLDLHAARFLGPAAKVFSDLMAALIFVLAGTGIWLYRLKLKTNGNGQP